MNLGGYTGKYPSPTGDTEVYGLSDFGNSLVSGNVIYDVTGVKALALRPRRDLFELASDSRLVGNTFCNTPTDVETGPGLIVRHNRLDAAPGDCDAEAGRILAEMSALARADGAAPQNEPDLDRETE